MFFAKEVQRSRVYVFAHSQGLFKPSNRFVRVRKIAPNTKDLIFVCANAQYCR